MYAIEKIVLFHFSKCTHRYGSTQKLGVCLVVTNLCSVSIAHKLLCCSKISINSLQKLGAIVVMIKWKINSTCLKHKKPRVKPDSIKRSKMWQTPVRCVSRIKACSRMFNRSDHCTWERVRKLTLHFEDKKMSVE